MVKPRLFRTIQHLALIISLSIMASTFANADQPVTVTHLAGSVHMLEGKGGNIGISAGEDGFILIDDQFADMAAPIEAALKPLSNGKRFYVVNTHYHADHTGGNAHFSTTRNATVFAHNNVMIRLQNDDKTSPEALPVVTYKDGVSLHLNNEIIHVRHLSAGHTDGDSIVYFERTDILHTGDLFFNGMFPYIDLSSGGDVRGYSANVHSLIERVDIDTKIIPGHGPQATRKDLEKFANMIDQSISWMEHQKSKKLSLEQIQSGDKPDWFAQWSWNFIPTERWVTTLYEGIE
ncbi:MBL fold metallo-hydrolase [Echinimonas agarilytica]|uniref:MBL fold metallo-hydrolase n=1 Tax=Echinimonas agarilytica TaxID=1215918 RepID=A0AA41WB17_9GAMM|nr:MBL fold metallo-hydrolase [Echinimonas agarilytica]MCM2681104.1 MBL fold metallo-hydrolase [Echinimonas agarilytica]